MNDNKQKEDERPLDEILSEILWRTYLLKQKAKEIQADKSITTKIIRWMNNTSK